jgi:hypothetical protein
VNTKSRYIPQICYSSGEFTRPADEEDLDKYKALKFKIVEHFKTTNNKPLFKKDIAKALSTSPVEVGKAIELGRRTFVAIPSCTKNEYVTDMFKVHEDIARFWNSPF